MHFRFSCMDISRNFNIKYVLNTLVYSDYTIESKHLYNIFYSLLLNITQWMQKNPISPRTLLLNNNA